MRARLHSRTFVVIVATLAILVIGTTVVVASHTFSDVPNSAFYHADATWMSQNGITAGCGGGKYCPNNAVTRGQMATFLHRLAPIRTIVETDGEVTDNSITTTYEELDTIGNFTKQRSGTVVKITWTDHVATTATEGTDFCDFQVRVDGTATTEGDPRAVNYGGEQSVEVTTTFVGLAAGVHEITNWVHGNSDTCNINNGNFTQTALVEEIPYA